MHGYFNIILSLRRCILHCGCDFIKSLGDFKAFNSSIDNEVWKASLKKNVSSFAVNLTSRPRCSQTASSSVWPAHPSHDIASSSQASRSLSSKQVDRGMLDLWGVLGSSGFQRCIWPTHNVWGCDHLLTNIYKANFLNIPQLSRTFCLIFLCACFMSIPALLDKNTQKLRLISQKRPAFK